jgi:ABC-type sugar transport system ATPase subunit
MITARGLTKRYGRTVAVRDLTFTVRPGAGKSTTMRMLIGLDRPDAGQATVNGKPCHQLRLPLLAHTTAAELIATASSLEDAFFRLTESASDYTGEIA